ncbi:MAG: amidohydrolase family protein [Euryarchaeota archaeon]|nr:amidohydrolase family protein [Euryarchaeota archaeon]
MDVLIKDGIVVTMDKERRVLKNFSLAIEDGVIVEIAREIKGEADFVIDARNKIVMPGLINTHTHAAMTLFRGSADDLPLMRWLQEEIWPVEAKLEPKHVYAGSLLACLEMLSSGITCFNDMYYHLEEVARSVLESGIRGVLSYPLLDIGGEEQGRRLLKEAERGLREYANKDSRVRVFLGPHAPYTCSKELLLKARELAEKHSTGIHIHVSETEEEVEGFVKDKGKRPFEYLDEIGFLGENVLAAHAVHVSGREIEIMKKRGVKVAHNPVSNMKLAAGVAPVADYVKAGVTVSLGTDGAASNNTLDLFQEMKTCALLQKVSRGDASAVPAQVVLEFATIGAAKALGLDREIGSLEVGKRGDVILVDLQRPNLRPLSNPVSHLVYAARGCDVCTVIVDGRVVIHGGSFRTLDIAEVCRFAEEEALDLFQKAGKAEKLFLSEEVL